MNVEPETTTVDAVVVDVAIENGTSKTRSAQASRARRPCQRRRPVDTAQAGRGRRMADRLGARGTRHAWPTARCRELAGAAFG